VFGLVVFAIDRMGSVIENYYAYTNPQTKIIMVTKTVHKTDTVIVRETIIKPDGTKIIKEKIVDKSEDIKDVEKREDSKPILANNRMMQQSLSISYAVDTAIYNAGYSVRYKNVTLGVSMPLVEPYYKGVVWKASLSF